jgi:hypothetical protein
MPQVEPDDIACVQDEISSLKSKLEECKTQLQSNEQMIRWLNNQVACRALCMTFCLLCCLSSMCVWLRETCIDSIVSLKVT